MFKMRSFKKIFCVLLSLPFLGFANTKTEFEASLLEEGIPIVNAIEEKDLLPGSFRTSSVVRLPKTALNLEGLGDLHVSGSSQFSECGLNAVVKKLNKKNITIVNLRQDDGGFLFPEKGSGAISFSYLMAMPWWTGEDPRGKRTLAAIEASEDAKMKAIMAKKTFTLYTVDDPYPLKGNHRILSKVECVVKKALTEKQLVEEKGLKYFRIPDKKFGNVEWEHVDALVNFVKELPEDEWVHFHCKKGHSRTTLFMVMFDMLKNADRVCADDILMRQGPCGLGGADLMKLPDPEAWDYAIKNGWLEFLHKFHAYAKENKKLGFAKTWSTWAQEKGMQPSPEVKLGDFYEGSEALSLLPVAPERTYNKSTLVINSLNESKLSLSNFRTTEDLWIDPELHLHLNGLNTLRASGSSQYSKEALKRFIKDLKPRAPHICVVDLRHDDHLFVNGLNVSTFESKDALLKARTPDEIRVSERNLKRVLQRQDMLELHSIETKYPKEEFDNRFTMMLKPTEVETPEEVVTSLGADYLLIGSKRFSEASDEDVDRFISYVRSHPKDTWYHFHCKKGKSRTTFFMILFDMMQNADKVSFEKIMERQKLIGGADLLDVTPKDPTWTQEKESKKQWIVFLARIHAYCKEQKKKHYATPWSTWSAEHAKLLPKVEHLIVDRSA